MNRVWISSAETVIPGDRPGINKIANNLPLPDGRTLHYTHFDFDPTTPHYPNARDVKTMREDVIAACIGMGSLLKNSKLTPDQLRETPLFVAVGTCNDGFSEDIRTVTQSYFLSDQENRNSILFQKTHPLFAVLALTNATQSYLAQIYGICGDNFTFGNTSASGLAALREAYERVFHGEAPFALAVSTHVSGVFTPISLDKLNQAVDFPAVQSQATVLLLESEESLNRSGRTGLVEIRINPQETRRYNPQKSIEAAEYFSEIAQIALGSQPIKKSVTLSTIDPFGRESRVELLGRSS